MATESPIRMPETSGNWPSHQEAATYAVSSASVAAEELGLLLKGHKFHGRGRDAVPNRSGSAPPSMEGSFLSIDNLLSHQTYNLNASFATLNSAIQNYESEEQMRADPAYLAYYLSNVNLNPRLPTPLISSENRRVARHIGFGSNWPLTSVDDGGNSSLHMSHGTLSTQYEESEDDQSPQKPSDEWLDGTSGFWSGQDGASSACQHRNVVDLTQEDLSCTPSPVYSQSNLLSHGVVEGALDQNADSSSLCDSLISTSNGIASTLGADDRRASSNSDPLGGPLSSSSSHDHRGSGDVNDSNITIIESEMKSLFISNRPNPELQRNQEQWQNSNQNNILQPSVHQLQNNLSQVQIAKSQVMSQGVNCTYAGADQFLHNPSKFTVDVQPVLQSSGFTPPLYATAGAYMSSPNAFYPNLQSPALYSPQYVGGYALNPAAVPPYVAGYSPHGGFPVVVDGTASPSYTTQTSGASSAGNIVHGADMQHLSKFYGQLGYPLQPSFGDPMYMQYHQQIYGETYGGISGQFDPLASRGGVDIGSQVRALDSQKASSSAGYLDDQKFHQRNGGLNKLNQRRGGLMSPNYYGNPPNMGLLMQYPNSPLASPILPGSPVGGTGVSGGRNEMRFGVTSGRNAGVYPGWQGQRAFESCDDPKVYNFLEELKSGKGRRFELSDIVGHIVEFSADQHGSRFIQQKLENCSVEEKASVFKEVVPHASKLMTDVFGNYVIQKFFEYGSPEQRKELANQLIGQVLPLSLQMYGCRVIQKALEVIELEQKARLVWELDGHVMRCVRDQNGNHVIQKCIESVPTEKIEFIISAFHGQVANLSMHPYGCRVIQRVLEHCTNELQCQFIVDEILESVCALAQDQYGNYVTQHVLERGKPRERRQIINKLSGQIVHLSQHKFASNVVEKCLEYGDPADQELLIGEIFGHAEGTDNLLTMMKDQFANYVIQKVLDICSDSQRALLLSCVRVHAHALKKYTYGKHIVARCEHVFGEESPAAGS